MMIRFSMVVMSVMVMGISAQAAVVCERAKKEGTSFLGSAYTDRLVNVYQNGDKLYSINFGSSDSYRDRAADACRQALESSVCQSTWVDATPGHIESDGLGRVYVEGTPAHMGVQNSVTGEVFGGEEACQISRATLAAKAAKKVKSEMNQARREAARIRQAEIQSKGWGPKI